MELTLEFGGGLEQLVLGEKKRMKVHFSEASPRVKLFHVISFVARRLLSGKAELFAGAYTPQDAGVYAQLQADRRALGEFKTDFLRESAESEFEKGSAKEEVQNETPFPQLTAESRLSSPAFHTRDLLAGCMQTRAGVLALVNEVDSEVLQGLQTPVSHGDTVTFISTLHGG
ncbi:hypothetical protein, conserved [Eimeria tenella]|uniref:Ubiquitin-related modifier 1 homolog n=1 Tax=Eimeria tenella TaxID=5802 RepID=U6L217_EIMTE|nr:hypothetical protein, conserved [Eimeria tenella]CDJ44412.1 hypothetical protein, conserved [Eimeria tenella]|eukprot:XP_013235161.1 hypothetical protein, conserved [Eimeria tenella]